MIHAAAWTATFRHVQTARAAQFIHLYPRSLQTESGQWDLRTPPVRSVQLAPKGLWAHLAQPVHRDLSVPPGLPDHKVLLVKQVPNAALTSAAQANAQDPLSM